jgi:hypothetical protein
LVLESNWKYGNLKFDRPLRLLHFNGNKEW